MNPRKSRAAGKERQRETAVAPRGVKRDPQAGQHWPALDGLRAIAVLGVILFHVGVLPGGFLGVDVFFVLSGFLITSLLISEWDKRGGRISFRNFYTRRVLRLFPALGCVLAASVVLAACLDLAGGPGDRPYALATLDAIPWVMVFAANWAPALGISPFLGLLGPAWSLAVEEQFYLLWPALFVLLMRRGLSRGRLALLLAVIAAAEMTYRVVMAHLSYGPGHIFYGTDTRSDGLIVGCAVAFWLASGQPARLHDRACKRLKGLAWLGAAVLGILFLIAAPVHASVEVGVAVLASGALLLGHLAGQTPAALERLLRSWWAVRIGRRSYGLYLWHLVVIAMARQLFAPYTGIYPMGGERRIIFAVVTGVAVAVSFGTAELSYRFVELPALRLKRRFQSEATQTTGGRPALTSEFAGESPRYAFHNEGS